MSQSSDKAPTTEGQYQTLLSRLLRFEMQTKKCAWQGRDPPRDLYTILLSERCDTIRTLLRNYDRSLTGAQVRDLEADQRTIKRFFRRPWPHPGMSLDERFALRNSGHEDAARVNDPYRLAQTSAAAANRRLQMLYDHRTGLRAARRRRNASGARLAKEALAGE